MASFIQKDRQSTGPVHLHYGPRGWTGEVARGASPPTGRCQARKSSSKITSSRGWSLARPRSLVSKAVASCVNAAAACNASAGRTRYQALNAAAHRAASRSTSTSIHASNLRQVCDTTCDIACLERASPGSRPALPGRQRRHGKTVKGKQKQAGDELGPGAVGGPAGPHRQARPIGRSHHAGRGPRAEEAARPSPGPGPKGPRPVSLSSATNSLGRRRRRTDPPNGTPNARPAC